MKSILVTLIALTSFINLKAQFINFETPLSINDTGDAPEQGALLDIQNSSSGLLIPRMNQAQRNAISMPANSLLVYQTDDREGFWFNHGTPIIPEWKYLESHGHFITDADQDTKITTEENVDEDIIRIKISGLEAIVVSFDNGNSKIETKSNQSNTFIGEQVSSTTSGIGNTILGHSSFTTNTSGQKNTAAGYQAMQENTTGSENTALGFQSLSKNKSASGNTAIGSQSAALTNVTGSISGFENTAVGYRALALNTQGSYNVAIGNETLSQNNFGSTNLAVGHSTGLGHQNGSANVFIGNLAAPNTNNNKNIVIGSNAFNSENSGNNVVIGANALNLTGSGAQNIVALGYNAGGATQSDTDYSIYIGYQSGFQNSENNRLYIENGKRRAAPIQYPDPLILGKFDEKVLEINNVLRLKPLSSAPSCSNSQEEGRLYYDANSKKLNVCQYNSATLQYEWKELH